MLALHEAGHALVCCKIPVLSPLLIKADIEAQEAGDAGGSVSTVADKTACTYEDHIETIAFLLGGYLGEKVGAGKTGVGVGMDLNDATRAAKNMVYFCGMGSRTGPVRLALAEAALTDDQKEGKAQTPLACSPGAYEDAWRDVRDIIAEGEALALGILTENKAALEALADALLERKTLTAQQIREIVEGSDRHGHYGRCVAGERRDSQAGGLCGNSGAAGASGRSWTGGGHRGAVRL